MKKVDMNWQTTLRKVKYPITVVVIDFETFFDDEYSLSKMSTVEFVTDSRFHFNSIATFEMSQPFSDSANVPFWGGEKAVRQKIEWLQKRYGDNFEQCTIVGQNLFFDSLILAIHFNIIPKYSVDVLHLARFIDSRRKNNLKYLCQYYDVGYIKGDTKQFKGLKYESMTDEQIREFAKYNRTDVSAETELFRLLLPQLSNPEIEIPLQQHTINLYLKPSFKLNYKLADEIKLQMKQELDKELKLAEPIVAGYFDKKHPDVTTIVRSNKLADIIKEFLPENEQLPTKKGKKGLIPTFAKTDEGFKYLLNHPKEEIRIVCNARKAAKSWPSHIIRLGSIINQTKARNGFLGVPLHYYGAHTGRWSGAEGINLQNLGGRGRGEGTHPLICKVRNTLIAPPGYTLLIGDYAQIEARVLAWFAYQEDLLQDFAAGKDIYAKFGIVLYNSPVRKPKENDPPPVYTLMKVRRGFAKDAILGLGYGMGATTFYENCQENPDLKDKFDFGFIQKAVKTYREKYYHIPELWQNLESRFRWVVKYPHTTQDLNGILFFSNTANGCVNLRLPNGRTLFYPHSTIIKKTIDNKTNVLGWRYGTTWGGSLAENVVQATSRDILAEALLKIEESGIHVIMHSHDEIISIYPKDKAEKGLEKMLDIMRIIPKWAQCLPIDVEGSISEYYKI